MAHSKITKNIRNSCGGAWNSERRIAQYYCKSTTFFLLAHMMIYDQYWSTPSQIALHPFCSIHVSFSASASPITGPGPTNLVMFAISSDHTTAPHQTSLKIKHQLLIINRHYLIKPFQTIQLWKLECEWVPPHRLCSSHCSQQVRSVSFKIRSCYFTPLDNCE